jgi:putative hydrolase of the HAD superfamily
VPATVLFFDLDGTLMVNPFAKEVFPTAIGKLAEATGLAPGTLADEIVVENRHRQARPDPANQALVMDWDDIIHAVACRHGVPEGTIPTDICQELLRQHAAPPFTATLDNAVEVLRTLRAPGRHRWFVVASMGLSKYQMPVLRSLGLYAQFDDFLMPDLTGCLKFERCFYERYLDDPGANRLFISIGDNYLHDVAFPRSLGFHPVLRLPVPELNRYEPFERPAHLAPYTHLIQYYPDDPGAATALPDAVITNLAELPAVVAWLEQQYARR